MVAPLKPLYKYDIIIANAAALSLTRITRSDPKNKYGIKRNAHEYDDKLHELFARDCVLQSST